MGDTVLELHPIDPVRVPGARAAQTGPRSFGWARDGGARRHLGVDLPAPLGTPIRAAVGGVVGRTWDTDDGRQGFGMRIDSPGGLRVSYMHMRAPPLFGPGEPIDAGTVIGVVGHSGNATANVLHIGATIDGIPVDLTDDLRATYEAGRRELAPTLQRSSSARRRQAPQVRSTSSGAAGALALGAFVAIVSTRKGRRGT